MCGGVEELLGGSLMSPITACRLLSSHNSGSEEHCVEKLWAGACSKPSALLCSVGAGVGKARDGEIHLS